MRPKSHEGCKYHFFWCRNAAGFGVRHVRYLATDSSGLEMKHGITKQNYCRGLGSQTVTTETQNWTEHKMYVLRYIRTWRGKKRVLLGHPGLPTDISVHTFAIHLPFQFIHLPFCSMILWNMHEANGITMVNINLLFSSLLPLTVKIYVCDSDFKPLFAGVFWEYWPDFPGNKYIQTMSPAGRWQPGRSHTGSTPGQIILSAVKKYACAQQFWTKKREYRGQNRED